MLIITIQLLHDVAVLRIQCPDNRKGAKRLRNSVRLGTTLVVDGLNVRECVATSREEILRQKGGELLRLSSRVCDKVENVDDAIFVYVVFKGLRDQHVHLPLFGAD